MSTVVEQGAPPAAGRSGEPHRRISSFYVYSPGVRMWHWVQVLLIAVLAVTGYFIGSPPPSVGGEASNSFVFGYIRATHFTAGYIIGAGLVWRAVVAVTGGKHAREIFFVPVWDKAYRAELLHVVKWYLFLSRESHKSIGHNALARATMFFMFVLGMTFMVLSGFGLYAEGTGMGSWQDTWFGWMRRVAGDSYTLHTWHHVGMWLLLLFALIHIYSAVRDEIMGRTSTISSIFSGWRTFRDDRE